MIVTRLVYSKKNPDYANIYIDGKFEASVLVDSVISLSLKSGDEITEIDLRALKSEAGWQKWIDKVLNYISIRPRSEKEIRDYIKTKLIKYKTLEINTGLEFTQSDKETQTDETKSLGVADNADLIDSLVTYLIEKKYVNDYEFAIWFLKQRLTGGSPKGVNFIRSELYSKGVSKQDIELAIEKMQSEIVIDEQTGLTKAFEKQVKKYNGNLNDSKIKQKIVAYLLQKGYKYTDIKLKVDENSKQI